MTFEEQQVQDAIDEGQPEEQIAQLRREAQTDQPEAAPIDRTNWTLHHVIGRTWSVRCDGHDVAVADETVEKIGEEYKYGFSVYLLGDTGMWPDGSEEDKRVGSERKDVIDVVRDAMEQFWAYCAGCGSETTEEDRALYLPYADDIGAYCASCRRGV